jgi:heme exporter protein D
VTISLEHVVDMGGYARFVWPAYGVTAIVLVGLLWASLRGWRRQRSLLDLLSEGRRARRRNP